MAEPAAAQRLDVAALLHVRRPLLVALLAGIVLLVMLATLPARPLIFQPLQKLAHAAVFGVAALVLLIMRRQRAPAEPGVGRGYLYALALATALGALSEIGQIYTHRDPSLFDVWRDARGAACALAFAAAFDARCRSSRSVLRQRAACLAAGIALALWILAPSAWAGAAYLNRAWRYPVLYTPDTPLDEYFVRTGDRAPAATPLPAPWARPGGEPTLHVPLLSRPYAGVALEEPSPDWRGYRALAVDVVNPGPVPLELHVRVHDRGHDWRYADRYNGQYTIAPATRQLIEIPLGTIENAPRGRRLDLAHIANVGLFRAGDGGPRELLLNRLELR
jgi:VanZ family protein